RAAPRERTAWAYTTEESDRHDPPFLMPTRKPTISESARWVSSVMRWAAASVSFMTCGRGGGFGLEAGVGALGVISVMWSIPAANQCQSSSLKADNAHHHILRTRR